MNCAEGASWAGASWAALHCMHALYATVHVHALAETTCLVGSKRGLQE